MKMKLLRLCSLILAFSLMINMIPVHTIAVETEDEETTELVAQEEIEENSQIINEIVENRTQFSKEYRMTNGLYMMVLYPEVVHYEKDGQWEDIDNTLKLAESRAGNVYTNTAGIWNVVFPQGLTSENGITITKDDYILSFRMSGALHRTGTQAEIIEETVEIMDVTEPAEVTATTEETEPVPEGTEEATVESTVPAEEVLENTEIPETQPIETETQESTSASETVAETEEPVTSEPASTIPPEEETTAPTEADETVPSEEETTEPPQENVTAPPETEVPAETVPDVTEASSTEALVAKETENLILGIISADANLSLAGPASSSAEIIDVDTTVLASEDGPQTPELENIYSKLGYSNVYDNTDVFFELNATQVKESIVINQYDQSLYGYTYLLTVGNLTPTLTDDGVVELYSSNGTLIMSMPAPYLIDDAGEISYDVEVQLAGVKDGYVLTYLLPRSWLADSSRQWPVILDPVVQEQQTAVNIQDRTICESTGHSYTYNDINLYCGRRTGYGPIRSYVQFNTLPTLTSADIIVSASIRLMKSASSGTSAPIGVHKVTGSWTSTSLTWSNAPGFVGQAADFTVGTSTGFYTWDITSIVQEWYQGANNGVVFKYGNEIEGNAASEVLDTFCSSDGGANVTHKPTITIIYRNNSGLESYWDYTTASAGRAGTGYINNYTGHLVWVRDELGFGGNRMPVSISRIYNANDCQSNLFGMGYGWRTNYNQRVYPLLNGSSATGYYVWEDADGTLHYFSSVNGTYKDEDGLELTLTVGASSYTITDKYGNKLFFDSKGRLTELRNNQSTTSSINITYTDTTNNYIKEITDGIGRKYTFSYYASNTCSRISYYGSGTTELAYITYAYHEGMLTTVTYMDNLTSKYTYVTNKHLSIVQDVDNYKLTYTYSQILDDKPSQVRSVTETDGSALGSTLSITYQKNQTTFKDQDDNIQIHQFNNWGNTVSIQDDMGRAQYAGYAYSDVVGSGGSGNPTSTYSNPKGNQLRFTSKLQNTVGNMLDNSSFESSSNWTTTSSDVTASSWTHSNAYIGNKFLKIQSTGATAQGAVSPSIQVVSGETYTFSAYVYSGTCAPYLQLTDGTTTVTSESAAADSTWTRLEVSYTATSNSVKARIMLPGTGTVFADCVQLELAPTASRFNLVQNGDFRYTTFWSASSGRVSNVTQPSAQELSVNTYKLVGKPMSTNRITQSVPVKGNAGDAFVLAGWGKAQSASFIGTKPNPTEFSLIATFTYTDGTTESTKVRFNPYVYNWQYASIGFRASKAYTAVTVAVAYDYNFNEAYFDGIQLYKEEFGTQYSYDANGNISSTSDIQSNSTTYVYDSGNNLKTVTENIGSSQIVTQYTYDNWHNVTGATTDAGVTYSFAYDAYGNNTSVTVGGAITSRATYSSDGNRLVSTTNAAGKVTTYNYDANTNLLKSVRYPNDADGTKTSYTYNNITFRLASVVKPITTSSTTPLTATYTYSTTDDTLTSIQTGSTTYNFTYGNFDLRSNVKIGNRILAAYSYTPGTNYLASLDYGAADSVDYSVDYTYDKAGRLTQQIYEDQETVTYKYDNDGALAQVTGSASGITTKYFYDFAGRTAKITEKGSGLDHRLRYHYSDRGNVAGKDFTVFGTTWDINYTYDDDNRMTGSVLGNASNAYTYDSRGRLSTKTTVRAGVTLLTNTYVYNANTAQISRITMSGPKGTGTLAYAYDNNGNIKSVAVTSADSAGTQVKNYTTSYTYDSANQLTRENNKAGDVTTVWTYDDAGNITSRKEYIYTTGTPTELLDTVNYTYGDSAWGDLLTKYDGQNITYDEIGNPTRYYNGTWWTFAWEHGRQLATMSANGTTWTNTYGGDGLRTKRSGSNGVSYTYVYDNGKVTGVQRTDNSSTLNMWIVYDESGPVTIKYGSGTFRYVLNQQGDVIALLNSSGESVVEYTYDAWGNILSTTGTFKETLGAHNPIRYRGYTYDQETSLYYCNSRYYDPKTGRFLNADALISSGHELLGNNTFVYCVNNPAGYCDPSGASPFGVLELWDYYLIHKFVQYLCVAENGWDMEVYVKGPLGRGSLDLYDVETNSYYEVKTKKTVQRSKALVEGQMLKYDASQIKARRYKHLNISESPTRGVEYTSGTFSYGIYDINYSTYENGLIVYEPVLNEQRSLQAAVALVLVICVAFGQYEAAVALGAYAAGSA